MQFDSLDDIRAFCRDLPEGDARAADAAARRQQMLTKPPGSLGRLEELAIWLARWQRPRASEARSRHHRGICRQSRRRRARRLGLSASRHRTDGREFCNAGGAAINQIARLAGADLRVVPIELERPTRDFTIAPAMDVDEFLAAIDIGYRTVPPDCDLLAVGEMGIANTTAAAMLCAALLGGGAERWAGRGTGVDDAGTGAQARRDRGGARAFIAPSWTIRLP